jgi:hypothetical protein
MADDWCPTCDEYRNPEMQELREALEKGCQFERAYQESLGATPTAAQWERLDSLQSAFIDAYVPLLSVSRPTNRRDDG